MPPPPCYSTPTRTATTTKYRQQQQQSASPFSLRTQQPHSFTNSTTKSWCCHNNNNSSCAASSSSKSSSMSSAIFWFCMGVTCTCMVLQQQWSTMVLQQYLPSSSSFCNSNNSNNNENDHHHQHQPTIWEMVWSEMMTTTSSSSSSPHNDDDDSDDVTTSLSGRRRRYQLSLEQQQLYQYQPPLFRRGTNNIDTTVECGSPPFFTSYFDQPVREKRSLSQEDATIYQLFFAASASSPHPRNKKLHYVELGAYNGIVESNTRFFDVCLGWEGLLIEANPRIYPQLVENRPYAHRYAFAPSCSDSNSHDNDDNHDNKQHPPTQTVAFWSSIFTNAVQDDVTNRQAYADKPVMDPLQPGPPKIDVPCASITPVLLHTFPQRRIHFFSLDVEGAEPGVLANLDFDEVFIDVLISESVNEYCKKDATCAAREQSRHILQSKGYLLFPDVVTRSDLFVHPRSEFAQSFLESNQTLYNPTQIERARDQTKSWQTMMSNKGTIVEEPSTTTTTSRLDNSITSGASTTATSRWRKYQHRPPGASRKRRQKNSELCGTAPLFNSFWALNETLRSRLNEDRWIYQTFFKNLTLSHNVQDQGTETTSNFHYLELGAFDGAQESNTHFFDVCLGWDGLLIEPNPRVFPRLVRNRPHAHRMSYAASCSAEEEAMNKTVGFWASIFTNAAQDESVNRQAYSNETRLWTEVPCGSLTPVLLDLFPPKGRIHFMSLDTEGTEHMVLQNIDFRRVHIDIIMSESENMYCVKGAKCEARDKTRDLLQRNGYQLYTDKIRSSDLFVRLDSEFAGAIGDPIAAG